MPLAEERAEGTQNAPRRPERESAKSRGSGATAGLSSSGSPTEARPNKESESVAGACSHSHQLAQIAWENPMAYRIEYSLETVAHLDALTARQRSMVFDAVDIQLMHQPAVETRNRKPMRPNPLAPWELRVSNLRVYYDIVEQPQQVVTVLAVGVKIRNRVRIGGEEFEL
jgi:hypothetical protein